MASVRRRQSGGRQADAACRRRELERYYRRELRAVDHAQAQALLGVARAGRHARPAACAQRKSRCTARDRAATMCAPLATAPPSCPCERVYVPEGTSRPAGYALLADAKGGAHFLLIPIRTLTASRAPSFSNGVHRITLLRRGRRAGAWAPRWAARYVRINRAGRELALSARPGSVAHPHRCLVRNSPGATGSRCATAWQLVAD